MGLFLALALVLLLLEPPQLLAVLGQPGLLLARVLELQLFLLVLDAGDLALEADQLVLVSVAVVAELVLLPPLAHLQLGSGLRELGLLLGVPLYLALLLPSLSLEPD